MARPRNSLEAAPPPRVRSEEVYAAALRLFNEKGYHATSMQDIAAAVGLYKGSLYHYIGGKEDLLEQVFERAMADLLVEVERIADDGSLSPRERSILNLGMIASLGKMEEFATHVRGALRNGLTPNEIRAVLTQIAVYCGIPVGVDCFRIAKGVLAEGKK